MQLLFSTAFSPVLRSPFFEKDRIKNLRLCLKSRDDALCKNHADFFLLKILRTVRRYFHYTENF